MAEPTLEQVFGTGTLRLASSATTPSAGIFIPDSVLVAQGLGTPSTATAEAQFVALIKASMVNLTSTNFNTDVDRSLYWITGFPGFITRSDNLSYRTDSLTLNLAKKDNSSTISPSDY